MGRRLIEGLSPREAEVLSWACEGKTASETALILRISEFTVGDHIRRARQKLDAVNIAHACVRFDRQARAKP